MRFVLIGFLVFGSSTLSQQASVNATAKISVKETATTSSPVKDQKPEDVKNVASTSSPPVEASNSSTPVEAAGNSSLSSHNSPQNVSSNGTAQIQSIVPMDNITKILDEHLKTDGGYSAAVHYLKSPEWAKLWEGLAAKKEWKDLMHRFNESGLPSDEFVSQIHQAIKEAKPTAKPAEKPSMRSAVNDVLEVLPFDKIMAAVNSSEDSPTGKKLSDPETKALIQKVKDLEEYKKVAKAVNDLDPLSPELKEAIQSMVPH